MKDSCEVTERKDGKTNPLKRLGLRNSTVDPECLGGIVSRNNIQPNENLPDNREFESMRPQTSLVTALPLLQTHFNTKAAFQGNNAYFPTIALKLSDTSKYISLLLYFNPAFRHGIGLEKGVEFPVDVFAKPDTPVTVSIFCSKDGGSTMSLSAFGVVVLGYPIESKVSSRSCEEL